jgi:hypothetical protein
LAISEEKMGHGIDDWMVAWNPGSGEVDIGPWPDRTGWSDAYRMTTGCCCMDRHGMTTEGKALMLFIDFNMLVVRDGVDPQNARIANSSRSTSTGGVSDWTYRVLTIRRNSLGMTRLNTR